MRGAASSIGKGRPLSCPRVLFALTCPDVQEHQSAENEQRQRDGDDRFHIHYPLPPFRFFLHAKKPQTAAPASFSLDPVSSFDGKYTANIETNGTMISIHISENGTDIFSFDPVRKTDFWGICWERDTYNLWIQSGDVGVICYQYEEGVWRFNSDAVRPEYIESKYD